MSPRSSTGAVSITGLGAVTPAGLNVIDTWAGVLDGVSTADRDPRLKGMEVDFCCAVSGFDGRRLLDRRTAARTDIVTQFAMVAAREAVSDAGLDVQGWDGSRVGVVVGNSFGGCATYEAAHQTFLTHGESAVSPSLMVSAPVNMNAGYLAMDLGATGPNMVISTACASGATAIGIGKSLLDGGICDVVVVGGTESFLTPTTMGSLGNLGALSRRRDDPRSASRPFDVARDGFVAGEGAAFLVLERPEDAERRGARSRASLLGYGLSADGYHPSAPDPTGASVRRAAAEALRQAGISGDQIDHVNAHGTSTPKNDELEAELISSLYPRRPLVTSTKGSIGHLVGAAGAVEAALTVLALESQQVPPTANLTEIDPVIDIDVVHGESVKGDLRYAASHSFGFGGQNAVLVFGAAR